MSIRDMALVQAPMQLRHQAHGGLLSREPIGSECSPDEASHCVMNPVGRLLHMAGKKIYRALLFLEAP